MPNPKGHPANLKPFKKGQSGNPGGVSKVDKALREMRDTHGHMPRAKLFGILDDPKVSIANKIRVAVYLDEQMNGKPRQSISIGGDEDAPPVKTVHVRPTKEEIKRARRFME